MFAAWGIAVRRLHMCEQVYCGLYNIYIFYQKPVSRNQNNYRQVKEASRQLPRSIEYPVPPQKKSQCQRMLATKAVLLSCHRHQPDSSKRLHSASKSPELPSPCVPLAHRSTSQRLLVPEYPILAAHRRLRHSLHARARAQSGGVGGCLGVQ